MLQNPENAAGQNQETKPVTEQEGAVLANELATSEQIKLVENAERAQMSSNKEELTAELEAAKQGYIEAEAAGDQASMSRYEFDQLATEAALDALAVEEEHSTGVEPEPSKDDESDLDQAPELESQSV